MALGEIHGLTDRHMIVARHTDQSGRCACNRCKRRYASRLAIQRIGAQGHRQVSGLRDQPLQHLHFLPGKAVERINRNPCIRGQGMAVQMVCQRGQIIQRINIGLSGQCFISRQYQAQFFCFLPQRIVWKRLGGFIQLLGRDAALFTFR